MSDISNVLCGISGEYFVAAELSRLGYITSLTLRNTKGIDILASNIGASRQLGIQVKSSRSNRRAWLLNEKAEDYFADNLFYVFVNLKQKGEHPDFYVVPSKVVAKYVKEEHKRFLKSPGKQGQKHRNTSMRTFRDNEGSYLEKWELLGL